MLSTFGQVTAQYLGVADLVKMLQLSKKTSGVFLKHNSGVISTVYNQRLNIYKDKLHLLQVEFYA